MGNKIASLTQETSFSLTHCFCFRPLIFKPKWSTPRETPSHLRSAALQRYINLWFPLQLQSEQTGVTAWLMAWKWTNLEKEYWDRRHASCKDQKNNGSLDWAYQAKNPLKEKQHCELNSVVLFDAFHALFFHQAVMEKNVLLLDAS